MAQVFFADKKILHDSLTKKSTKSVEKLSEKKTNSSWSSSLGGMFKVIQWIANYKLYRPFAILPYPILNGIGHLMGYIALGRSRKVYKRMHSTMKALHPDFSEEKLKKLCKSTAKYLGQLLLDVILRMNYVVDTRTKRALDFGDFTPLQNALKQAKEKGTGVILVSNHLGQQFHSPLYIFRHPDKFKMDVIASINNLPMWEICNRKDYTNLLILPSTKFSLIRPYLEQNLRKNHVLFIYHDYSSKKQLRAPLWHGKFPYLVHTPQSHISLQKATDAIILPAIAYPVGTLGKSRYQFLDNTEIMETARKYKHFPDKVFHGEMSKAINKAIYPSIWQYTNYWEEIMRLWTMRMEDSIKFVKNITLKDFNDQIFDKMEQILEMSYEPGRPDDKLLTFISTFRQQILAGLSNPTGVLRPHKTKIDLTGLGGIDEILKLTTIAQKELSAQGETQTVNLWKEFASNLKN